MEPLRENRLKVRTVTKHFLSWDCCRPICQSWIIKIQFSFLLILLIMIVKMVNHSLINIPGNAIACV
ncbi:hypothetical protein HanXRQr2_Chr05g0232351 [Helianthus annuus]|uniref:Uncharacterized protein n=1 Tax=Helianthus annuus TaxID=4232 RepID=A0A9K3NQ37_HELAN|nr:hypothetical protein HanXRQr2_Chr05g0232351 [Helianthus annuus]KAJ0924077.1 hypothetical protein HanPSC8_Chr05g0224081 [Helianthus annuus]